MADLSIVKVCGNNNAYELVEQLNEHAAGKKSSASF
jgi:hypothetical protein